MASEDIIKRTASHVQQLLGTDATGHDWFHVDRVRRNALQIARAESADLYVVELAALLHDIADWKFHGGDDKAGSRTARQWLETQGERPAVIEQVCEIIDGLSFKGAGVPTPMASLEGASVQDADRLEAIGAIGIARAFAYGGSKRQPIYDPQRPPVLHASFDDYKKNSGSTINHFYEKLLLLKDRLQTATARRMAAERHRFLEEFLVRFLAEWNDGG